METSAGTVAVLARTDATPTVTQMDSGQGSDEFLIEIGEGAFGVVLTRTQLRAFVDSALEALMFDPDQEPTEG